MSKPGSSSRHGKEFRNLLLVAFGLLAGVLICVFVTGLYFAEAFDLLPSSDQVQRSIRQERVVRTRTTPQAEEGSRSEELSERVPLCDVHFFFQTEAGDPVYGSAFMDREHVRPGSWVVPASNGDQLTAMQIPCSPTYRLSFRGHNRSRTKLEVESKPGEDTYFITIEPWLVPPICPLRVVFETDSDNEVSGRARLAFNQDGKEWTVLDDEGAVEFPAARCETDPMVWLEVDSEMGAQPLKLVREPEHLSELRVELKAHAKVRVVDEEGMIIEDATVGVEPHGPAIETLSPGEFELVGIGQSTSIRVNLFDQRHLFDVDLDGTVHTLEIPEDRTVDVTLRCDACEGRVRCGTQQCDGANPHWQCTCPNTPTQLVHEPYAEHRYGEVVAVVPADVDALIVDLRGDRGAVKLQTEWNPSRRLNGFALHRTTSEGLLPDSELVTQRLGSDGQTWMNDQVLPGPWLLTWESHTQIDGEAWQTERHSREIVVGAGETLDLGTLGG
ncbi:MAG TPA: hypothetical protein DFR83_02325 [Deltaproteobacteria bacterium]|nr:hypothetical protein [Deltaproteobacteria bacterium]